MSQYLNSSCQKTHHCQRLALLHLAHKSRPETSPIVFTGYLLRESARSVIHIETALTRTQLDQRNHLPPRPRLRIQFLIHLPIDLLRSVYNSVALTLAEYHISRLFPHAWTSSLYCGLSLIHKVIPIWFFVIDQDTPTILSFVSHLGISVPHFLLHRVRPVPVPILYLHHAIPGLLFLHQAKPDTPFFFHQLIPDPFSFSHHGSCL